MKIVKRLLAVLLLAASLTGAQAPHLTEHVVAAPIEVYRPAVVGPCHITQNRTVNPDRATVNCSGTGQYGFHIRCKYFTNGPYLHRSASPINAPGFYTLNCTSTYPIIHSAWVDTAYPF
jgi:hypothetical protein